MHVSGCLSCSDFSLVCAYVTQLFLTNYLKEYWHLWLKIKTATQAGRVITVWLSSAQSFPKSSKLLFSRFSDNLRTNDNQFACKCKPIHGTDLAISLLRTATLEYTRRSTQVYACFLGISKAFERTSLAIPFQKLFERSVSKYIVHLLREWYANQRMNEKRCSSTSTSWTVTCGVKQGSILSPFLVNIRMDEFSTKPNSHKIDCYIIDQLVNHLTYADDTALFCSSSVN